MVEEQSRGKQGKAEPREEKRAGENRGCSYSGNGKTELGNKPTGRPRHGQGLPMGTHLAADGLMLNQRPAAQIAMDTSRIIMLIMMRSKLGGYV